MDIKKKCHTLKFYLLQFVIVIYQENCKFINNS